MAFFLRVSSSVSSGIVKRLLLFALSRLDLLDKDPSDFVEVSVGKRSTLELRDVGLRVKRLSTLLHLDLPPQIQLAQARVSLLRLTLSLEPQNAGILIEVEGVRILASLSTETRVVPDPSGTRLSTRLNAKARKGSPPPPLRGSAGSLPAEDNDGDIPTAEDLAKSFLEEEPEEERQELEAAFQDQSHQLQDSIYSEADSEDGSGLGIGASPSLPGFLENFIKAALDRSEVLVKDIDVQLDTDLTTDTKSLSDSVEPMTDVSINLRIERVSIEGLSSDNPEVTLNEETRVPASLKSNLKDGKRRLSLKGFCARLVSEPELFANLSGPSRPVSPVDIRSESSASQKSNSQSLTTPPPVPQIPEPNSLANSSVSSTHDSDLETLETSELKTSARHSQPPLSPSTPSPPSPSPPPESIPPSVESSLHIADEDRFADAPLEDSTVIKNRQGQSHDALDQSQHHSSSGHEGDSVFEDRGFLDYALEQGLLESGLDDEENGNPELSTGEANSDHNSLRDSQGIPPHRLQELASTAPSLPHDLISSGLSDDAHAISRSEPGPPHSLIGSGIRVVDNKVNALEAINQDKPHDASAPVQNDMSSSVEDLTESRLFSHEDAESMYMSALSEADGFRSRRVQLPGGWDSASSSSESTVLEPIPNSPGRGLVSPTEPENRPEVEDGSETPRPGSPTDSRTRDATPTHSQERSSHFAEQKPEKNIQIMPEDRGEILITDPRVSKPFLTIDEVSVWFPWPLFGDKEELPKQEISSDPLPEDHLSDTQFLSKVSGRHDIPGSFSLYASQLAERESPASKLRSSTYLPKSVAKQSKDTQSKPQPNNGIEVNIGSVGVHFDVSSTRMLHQLIQRITSILDKPSGAKPEQHTPTPTKATTVDTREMMHKLVIEDIFLVWVESLGEEPYITQAPRPFSQLERKPRDTILKCCLQTLRLDANQKNETLKLNLRIAKHSLGLADSNIISFDARARMRTSVRDLRENLEDDISIDFTKSTQKSEINIRTLPLMVTFELQKLDDALSSFGGFSGILELSNSISSNSALQSPIAKTPQRPRGVHFEQLSDPNFDEPTSGLKVNARLGGTYLVLTGKSCSVRLQTSAVKVVARERIVGIGIDEIKLSGPHLQAWDDDSSLLVALHNTRMEYLFTPAEKDLSRLLSLITPSKDKYEDDDILVDTLLRQRKKGSVIRASLPTVRVDITDIEKLKKLASLGEELAKFSSVTKYLPEDDRPGILTLGCIDDLGVQVFVNERIGSLNLTCKGFQVAHVGLPPLLALEIGTIAASRGHDEVLLHEVVPSGVLAPLPMVTARMISDEMEPTVKVKLCNLCVEYRVPTIMAVLGLKEDGTTVEDLAAGLASSVATIIGNDSPKSLSRQPSDASSSSDASKSLHVDILLRDCALGLNPRGFPSKSLFVFTNTRFRGALPRNDNFTANLDIRKGSLLLIDDENTLLDTDEEDSCRRRQSASSGSPQVLNLCRRGYVSLSTISSASAIIKISGEDEESKTMDIEFKDELLVLESCADSTQTLIALLNGLKPPTPTSTVLQYRTKVMPVEDMMASFSGDAFTAEEEFTDLRLERGESAATFPMDEDEPIEGSHHANLEEGDSMLLAGSDPLEDQMMESMNEDPLNPVAGVTDKPKDVTSDKTEYQEIPSPVEELDFDDNFFNPEIEVTGVARKWDSSQNRYGLDNEYKVTESPLKVRVRDMHIIWNLYDGYDWGKTRDTIAKAVQDVEDRAEERRNKRAMNEIDQEDNIVIEEDFLFNSIWISIPVNEDRDAIRRQINHEIDDQASETGSYATSTATRSTNRTQRHHRPKGRRLKLDRSRHQKITFELKGVSADVMVFPPGSGETQSSIDVRVRDLEIFDHVPTSTWRKFATYMHDAGERQMNRPMIHLEILVVKPVSELAASELVLKVSVLPLRLHVDQDALDFITRFFEFKDDSAVPEESQAEKPFLQRVEVETVLLKLDYKPKKVNYAGLRSGHTKEFMNFFILDGADIMLKHIVLFGISGFDRLHTMLNDIWIPDVTGNQLPGIIASLAAVKSLSNVGSGVRDLVVIPIREYKKDGRIVRSIQKGATSFARTTTSELARLGAKVAIGTQTYLQSAEDFLSPTAAASGSSHPHTDAGWEDISPSGSPPDEERRAISNYADQPIGVMAGLRGAARSLERDLMTVKDVIIAIPGEVMETESATGAAMALARRAPTVILRPAVGATKAIGTALLGVGNAIDKDSRRKIDDKYKRR